VSSAILYLAIIAIWACVLVPRWVHRPHRRMSAARSQATAPEWAEPAEGTVPPPAAESDAGPGPGRDAFQAAADGFWAAGERFPAAAAATGDATYSRAHVMQSRRRLLTMLVTLMAASLTCTVTGLSPWWVLAPSGGMLGMYLLLLREAANADAERAQWLAQEHAAYLEAAQLQAGEAGEAREAWEASQPQPTAEIIDISDRVGDQLYDQYADAAVRAVGD
jgi:hypothetical protein